MSTHTLRQGNTNVLEIARLFDQVAREYPDPADVTVTATLADGDGNLVSGAENLPCDHVTGTKGSRTLYRCTLSHTLPLVVDEEYTLTVIGAVETVDGSAQYKAVDSVDVIEG